jgi:hypothetical protein
MTINQCSVDACRAENYGAAGTFRFTNRNYNNGLIPGSILHALTGEDVQRLPDNCFGSLEPRAKQVVLIFMDGTLYKLIGDIACRDPAFNKILDGAVVSMLTSQFPSNTVPHVTTMATGLTVAEHACAEWTIRLLEHGSPIKPFRNCDTDGVSLTKLGIPPSCYLPKESFYQKLSQKGLSSAVMSWDWMEQSPPNAWFYRGATFLGYKRPQDIEHLLPDFLTREQPDYTYLYFETNDEIGHILGPDSPEAKVEYAKSFAQIAAIVEAIRSKDRLILLMSDHGQVPINLRWPASTICLDDILEGMPTFFVEGPQGKPFYYTGGCRDAFLHIKESCLDYVHQTLANRLEGRAEVILTETLVSDGVFGEVPANSSLLSRIGNLAVLPYRGWAVTMKGYRQEEVPNRGYHGGMEKEEMEVPFIVIRG